MNTQKRSSSDKSLEGYVRRDNQCHFLGKNFIFRSLTNLNLGYISSSVINTLFDQYCHSPTQPQHELVPDLIMGRKKTTPPHPPELLRHFQAT